jgi:hypothetical protein
MKKMPQDELVKKIEVHAPIGRYERSEVWYSFEVAVKIVDAFRVVLI